MVWPIQSSSSVHKWESWSIRYRRTNFQGEWTLFEALLWQIHEILVIELVYSEDAWKHFHVIPQCKIRHSIGGNSRFSCFQLMCTQCARTSDCAMLQPFQRSVESFGGRDLVRLLNITMEDHRSSKVYSVVRWWGLVIPISIAFW